MGDLHTARDTDWYVATPATGILHHAPTKKDCLDWVADRHGLTRVTGRRTSVTGAYDAATPDVTYQIITATALPNLGYASPTQPDAAVHLANETSALIHDDDGPALIWHSRGALHRQPAPPGTDPDTWAEQTARRLVSYGITYTGRLEPDGTRP